MPSQCANCENRAVIVRPKNRQKLCKQCFISVFEVEIHRTVTNNVLFHRGEKVAIGASGGKDSTVLASVLKTLNERYDYGLDLVLLAIDEGIKGYRDDALETVKRNSIQYDLPLEIVGYDRLYGWTMDQVVDQVGRKGNCTYCGVFRRQALDRGAAMLGVKHVVTGHNADDMAETVMMNLLRADLPRLSRSTNIVTSTPSAVMSMSSNETSNIKRSKPLKYAYEKEIVLYAFHKDLDYFSTECIYSPEAFRGSARALIKDLERIRPSAILDIVRSGEDMAELCPGFKANNASCAGQCTEEEEAGGCGRGIAASRDLQSIDARAQQSEDQPAQTKLAEVPGRDTQNIWRGSTKSYMSNSSSKSKYSKSTKVQPKQTVNRCANCGYMSSQSVCKACMLLEGLNRNKPKTEIIISGDPTASQNGTADDLVKSMASLSTTLE